MAQPAGSDYGFQEWNEARAVIGRFDNNLHDLRKYGFSFITALLTADAILSTALPGATSVVPGYLKLGVLLVTLGLFVSLRLLDQHYRLYQQAASRRARILERRLNVELTEEITNYYDLRSVHWWENVRKLYYGFLLLTTGLGIAIVYDSSDLVVSLGDSTVLVLGALLALYLILRIGKQGLPGVQDWTIDKKIIREGDNVRIGWTHFREAKKEKIKHDTQVQLRWRITRWEPNPQPTGQPVGIGSGEVTLTEPEADIIYYDWLWKVAGVSRGLYNLEVATQSEKFGKVFTIQVEDTS